MLPTPAVSLSTTPCLKARSLSTSTFGSPNVTPQLPACFASSMTFATCSSAFEGMQPAIETDAAGVLLLVDERDLHAEVRRVEGRRISARARAEHRYLSGFCHQPISERRKGCSIASTTQRRKRIASAPSITRWSYESDSGSICRGSNRLLGRRVHTGSVTPRETPRIATSGQFTIGVK